MGLYHKACGYEPPPPPRPEKVGRKKKEPQINNIKIYRLVAGRNARFADFQSVQSHAYFSEVDWNDLRSKDPPFVPELDGEKDAGYFDDFSNSEDMAKYKEVHDKQAALEGMADRGEKMNKSAFLGFTFRYALVLALEYTLC